MLSNEVLVDLIKRGRIVDLYKLARFTYRVGVSILDDATYEQLQQKIKALNLCPEIVNRAYDDDPIPYRLLEEFELTNLVPNFTAWQNKYGSSVDEEKSLSINAVDNYTKAFEYFNSKRDVELIFSTKVNGVNGKALYTKEDSDKLTFRIGKSRGRTKDSIDYTRGLSRVIPLHIDSKVVNDIDLSKVDNLFIYGEGVVVSSAIGQLVSPTGVKPTIERMAAVSMLRTNYNDEDYKYLRYKVFGCEGLCDKISDSLEVLKELGFDVVPYLVIKPGDYPTEFEEFCTWLKDKMTIINELTIEADIPADGVVVDVNDTTYIGNVDGQYSDKNIALKFEYWSHKYYQSKVLDIEFTLCASKYSVNAVIEPKKTADGSIARNVNLYSPRIMIREGIVPGSTIYFKRDSEVINNLVYGEDLVKLLRE